MCSKMNLTSIQKRVNKVGLQCHHTLELGFLQFTIQLILTVTFNIYTVYIRHKCIYITVIISIQSI